MGYSGLLWGFVVPHKRHQPTMEDHVEGLGKVKYIAISTRSLSSAMSIGRGL